MAPPAFTAPLVVRRPRPLAAGLWGTRVGGGGGDGVRRWGLALGGGSAPRPRVPHRFEAEAVGVCWRWYWQRSRDCPPRWRRPQRWPTLQVAGGARSLKAATTATIAPAVTTGTAAVGQHWFAEAAAVASNALTSYLVAFFAGSAALAVVLV